MKVVFLDFDGVLNSSAWRENHARYGASPIEPDKMNYLKRIIQATQAEIVLTTSWRDAWEAAGSTEEMGIYIDKLFAEYGLTVYAKVPDIDFFSRDKEIAAWLEEQDSPAIEAYCILDDVERLFKDETIRQHLVLTDQAAGIMQADVVKATEMLKGNTEPGGR